MGNKILVFVISALLLLGRANNAQAFEVHDPLNKAELVKLLNEAKKQIQELQDIVGKAVGIQQRLGDLTQGGMTIDAWMNRGQFLGQCLAPEIMNFRLPDGITPRWTDLCDGVKSAEQMLLYNPDDVSYDGKRITNSDKLDRVNERRAQAHAEAVVKSYAMAKQSINSSGELDTAAARIIERSNAEVTVIGVQRETNRALASILREMKQQRLLTAQMLELMAASESQDLGVFGVNTGEINQ